MIGSKRSRAKTLALLCLMAHALFVCFTHFHDAGRAASPSSTVTVTANGDGDPHRAPGSAGDSHCLSCRLQRNFVSDAHTASVIVDSIEEPLSRAIFLSVIYSRGSRQSLSGRAPPRLA